MSELTQEANMRVAGIFQGITQKNPPLTHLNLEKFSSDKYFENRNAGDIIIEALLNSSICSIYYLNLGDNKSWFNNSKGSSRNEAVIKLAEIISKQTSSLQILDLNQNYF